LHADLADLADFLISPILKANSKISELNYATNPTGFKNLSGLLLRSE
jgi:hypothetical protein